MPLLTEQTTFTRDLLGRYVCNTMAEARASADTTARADARPFDLIVIGGGSFGAVLAHHLFANDKAHSHRILVLDEGRFLLPEHVQNLPVLGHGPPGPTTEVQGPANPRNEVWRQPWRSDVAAGFPGLAYCLGGRSIYFGGWSPQPLDDAANTEMPLAHWPSAVVNDLNATYFRQASEQIGTTETNDFIHGEMHRALRQQLHDGIVTNQIPNAVPLSDLPLHLDDVPAGQEALYKLEAPLAVLGRPPRSGFFPLNKFSSVPLLIAAVRAAWTESGGDDVKKRLMIVPTCHVKRLITSQEGSGWRVVALDTDQGQLSLPAGGAVFLALGTIESARLALISFPNLANADQLGRGLMAHLRSNLTIRIPRTAIATLDPTVQELQASALFVKGRHTFSAGGSGYFHLQITAAGLDKPGTDSEAELFKKIPDIDTFAVFRTATDTQIVITVRGIGEMEPASLTNRVSLAGELDDFNLPRAFVSLNPGARDQELWDAMDAASDAAALVFAGAMPYEVLTDQGFKALAAGASAQTAWPFHRRRDGMGTTHHEAGTLRMGNSAGTSVADANGRFHHSPNTYVVGPAAVPTVGSPNPMLTGVALARRLAAHVAPVPTPYVPADGFTPLFNGFSTEPWKMAGKGRFLVVDGALESQPGDDLGLLWHTTPTPADFTLRLEWKQTRADDNAGVFVRFPHPDGKGYNNTAWVGVHFGFEVQIDELARPDGADIHRTGAIYAMPGQTLTPRAARPVGEWNEFEIRVQGQTYTVFLNGQQVTTFTFAVGSDPAHPDRGLPSTPGSLRFVGLQAHTGRVSFRNIRILDTSPAPLAAPAVRARPAAEPPRLARDRDALEAAAAIQQVRQGTADTDLGGDGNGQASPKRAPARGKRAEDR